MAESKKDIVAEEGDDAKEVVDPSDKAAIKAEGEESDCHFDAVLDELAGLRSDVAQTSERRDTLSESAGHLEGISGDVKELLRFRGMITGVIDKLHEEIEEKKVDTRHKTLKPFLKDLISY